MRPSQPVFQIAHTVAGALHGPHRDVLLLVAPSIETRDLTFARTRINDVRVVRIRLQVAALTTARVEPVLPSDVSIVGAAGNANRRIILLRPVNVIQKLV